MHSGTTIDVSSTTCHVQVIHQLNIAIGGSVTKMRLYSLVAFSRPPTPHPRLHAHGQTLYAVVCSGLRRVHYD